MRLEEVTVEIAWVLETSGQSCLLTVSGFHMQFAVATIQAPGCGRMPAILLRYTPVYWDALAPLFREMHATNALPDLHIWKTRKSYGVAVGFSIFSPSLDLVERLAGVKHRTYMERTCPTTPCVRVCHAVRAERIRKDQLHVAFNTTSASRKVMISAVREEEAGYTDNFSFLVTKMSRQAPSTREVV